MSLIGTLVRYEFIGILGLRAISLENDIRLLVPHVHLMVISETSRHLGNYDKTDNEPTDRRGGRTDGVIVKFRLQ